jgi:hypothetical protein
MHEKIKINFTDFWPLASELKRNPIYYILAKKFDLEISSNPDFLVYSCFGTDFLKYKCVRIFYTGENVRPDFNECDYAFSFDFPVTEKNYRLPVYGWHPGVDKLIAQPDVDTIFSTKTKFCNFVYSNNRAKERIRFFEKLSRYKQVDSGGKVLNNIGHRVGNKAVFLKPYKFTIAFENESYPGYTTEKIWEAKVAQTVPIYWGNPLVHKDFNPKAFVNCHDYKNFDKVIERIVEIDNNDDLYRQYLSEPFFYDNIPSEFVDRNKVRDRFEYIFNTKIEPVAKTRKNYWVDIKYLPKRIKYTVKPAAKKLLTQLTNQNNK